MIGRERELAALSAALVGAREGGRIVVVEGEAGVGKTVLLGALAPAMSVSEAFAGAHLAAVLRERGEPGAGAVADPT
ncbi:MAG TPA: AAA family ATPase [Solirubrobacterales bacterium]